jgi:DNA polymerase I-like protein with 3'-5' exonuclease and polymerase domains
MSESDGDGIDDGAGDGIFEFLESMDESPIQPSKATTKTFVQKPAARNLPASVSSEAEGDSAPKDIFDFLEESSSLKVNPQPWMIDGSHHFVLGTVNNIAMIMDECIASGLYSLDIEATGLDNRVFDGETVDKIVGVCLSADGVTGYYIPLRHKIGIEHNVPWSIFKRELLRLLASPARAIFHLGKFDQEFLQFCGGEPLGEWDDVKKWEDTLILAYLRDPRQKRLGLKYLSETELGMKMIELEELFPEEVRKSGRLDFSELDPSSLPVLWYGGSDGICTRKLFPLLYPVVTSPGDGNEGQSLIYAIEKLCVAATRWMERARVPMDQEKARELIRIGQREWISSLEEVYKSSSEIVGRDVRPGYYRLMSGMIEGHSNKFDVEEVSPSYMDRVEGYREEAAKLRLDPTEVKGKKTVIRTILKRVPSLVTKGVTEEVEFPLVYDPLSAQQLGQLLRECKIPGLSVTEKSGQVSTAAEEMDRVLEEQGNRFPFAGKIKRFREIGKALSTYLLPVIEDCAPDGSLRATFNAHKLDTGRFNCKSSKNPKLDGGTRFPFHGTPSTYDPKRPECMARIRECIIARPGKILAALDFSGVELRIVTNLSYEPKWLREFFHCTGCDHMFDAGDGTCTPEAPPPFCPICGSDKIGDLHTLTALSIYGADAITRPDWKVLRGNGKITNFALCYGGGGNAVDAGTGCGKQEGWRIKDQFDKSYRGLAAWWKSQHAFAKKFKYVLTAFGRRYPLPDIDHEMGGFRAKAERNATNGPIQGTSADITKLAMGLIHKECKKRGWLDKVHMLITMHDELVFEIDYDILAEAIDVFVKIMNSNPSILKLKWRVPLTSDVEMGLNWMVPWSLNKMRKTGKWPDELRGLFPESNAVHHESVPIEVKQPRSEAVRIYSIKSFSLSEVMDLAELITRDGVKKDPAVLKILGPNGEDLTGKLMAVWGGVLPEVEA